jgi:peptide/nickel transport system permease protein
MSEQKKRTRWSRFVHSPLASISAILITVFVIGAILAPWIMPQNPYDLAQINLRDARTPPIWQEDGKWPYILGTDADGRDIFSTIFYGLQISFMVSVSAVVISAVVGILAGLIAGFYGGWSDTLLMRLADIVFPFSTTLTAILLMGLLEARGIIAIVAAISIINWVRYARTARGSTLSVRGEEYISAILAQGAGGFRILLHHVLPNAIQPLIVIGAVDFAVVIVLESTLSFLGIGVPVSQPSLGTMISRGNSQLLAGHWWMLAFPGIVLVTLTMAINLIGDWLRDELDPRQQGRSS